MNQKVQFFVEKMEEAFQAVEHKFSSDLFSKVLVVKLDLERNKCKNMFDSIETPEHDLHKMIFATSTDIWSENNFFIDSGK